VLDFLIPALFIGVGLAIGWRGAWLRRRQASVPTMLRVCGLFAIWAGIFLAALLIMCKP